MLEKLLAKFESEDPEADAFARIDSIRFDGDDGVLCLSVGNVTGSETWVRWQVSASGLRDYTLTQPYGDLTLFRGDHPLIRQYTDQHHALYFSGQPSSALEVLGALLVAHKEAAGDWIPLEKFTRPWDDLCDVLRSGNGLLADGPGFLIERYADVLSAHGVTPNALAPRPATWWDGEQFKEYPAQLVALAIGNSFLVAESFEAEAG